MVLTILNILLALSLVASIMLQPDASGVGGGFGQGGGETYHTRRGLEKVLFQYTFIGIVLFVITSLLVVALG